MERKMYKCEPCKMTFNRRERWESHIKRGCNRTTCKTCKKKFQDVGRLRRHESTHIPKISRWECTTCEKTFHLMHHLQNHQENSDSVECDLCDRTFCHRSELERHKRTVHTGQGINKTVDDEDLKQPICPPTRYEEMEEYQEEMTAHISKIRDSQNESDVHLFLNKQTTPAFTYADLKKLIIRNNDKSWYCF